MKSNGRARRRSREEWNDLVGEWRASGKPMKEFAHERGLSANCLSYWSSTLKQEPRKVSAPRLLPVRLTPSVESPAVELALGPVRLRFEGGTSPTYIAEVTRALLAAGSA